MQPIDFGYWRPQTTLDNSGGHQCLAMGIEQEAGYLGRGSRGEGIVGPDDTPFPHSCCQDGT